MIVYLVRHTAVLNPKKFCYGQSEIPLASTYPKELQKIRRLLPQKFDVCFSSPLKRCLNLAGDLYTGSIQTSSALLELNFGEWELRAWSDIDRQELDEWGNNFVTAKPPAGESFEQLQARVINFWSDLVKKYQHGTVLIVTHGGVIRALRSHITETSLSKAFNLPLLYGAVIKVEGEADNWQFTDISSS